MEFVVYSLVCFPVFLLIYVYLVCILQFSKLSRSIYNNYVFLITLKTDWKNTFLEDLAEGTRNYFHVPFISICKLKDINTARMIISSGDSEFGYLIDSVEKDDYHLNKRKKFGFPFVYKTEESLIHRNQKNENLLKSFRLNHSFMIPIFFADRKEEGFISLYFNNKFSCLLAYFKYICINTKFSHFYASIFRNFCMSFESSAELLLDEIEDYAAVSLDEKGKIVSWNKGARNLFGYRSVEIVGQNFSVLFDEGEEESFKKSLEILKIKKDVKYFSVLKDRMNIPIKIELKIKTMFSVTGELAGYSVFVKDITKEEIFKDNIQQYSFINYTILENSQDGILILDSNDKIIFYNHRLRVILDNSMNLFGVPGKKIFPRRFGEEFEKAINQFKKTNLEFLDIDYCFERKYYNIRFFRVHKNSNNDYGGVIVFFIDESIRILTMIELEEKKEALENINKNLLDAFNSAKVIQYNLIPKKLPSSERMSCEAIYELSDDLGGDFYYIEELVIEDKIYAFGFISDVSGHGISSSMMNVMVKDVYGTYRETYLLEKIFDPALFLQLLNRKLLDLDVSNSKFITCIAFFIDFSAETISMSSSGHTLPYLISGEDVKLMEFDRSVPLGIMDKIKTHTEVLKYTKQDRLICYTDGFLDLFEIDSQKPSDSAKKFLQKNRTCSLEELKNLIQLRRDNFKEQHTINSDDLTVLMIKFD
ncbi:MAG: SpoIIE family protein phosphatase [Brevinemataceae bacterium]